MGQALKLRREARYPAPLCSVLFPVLLCWHPDAFPLSLNPKGISDRRQKKASRPGEEMALATAHAQRGEAG